VRNYAKAVAAGERRSPGCDLRHHGTRRVLIFVLWMIVVAAVAGAMKLPASSLDICVKDRYMVVSKPSPILVVARASAGCPKQRFARKPMLVITSLVAAPLDISRS
jgi:hypothetical protein